LQQLLALFLLDVLLLWLWLLLWQLLRLQLLQLLLLLLAIGTVSTWGRPFLTGHIRASSLHLLVLFLQQLVLQKMIQLLLIQLLVIQLLLGKSGSACIVSLPKDPLHCG